MPIFDFENLLRRTMGLDAASMGPSAIESAVCGRMMVCKLKDREAYGAFLQASEAEMQELIEAVIVPETWFFRDRGAFSALVDWVVGKWLPANPGGRARLLSLPCSSGEEPYSMVMALLDAGLPESLFQIDAVDISALSLERARQGVYGGYSFRGKDIAFRDRYFEPVEHGYLIAETVRRQVRFLHGNLLNPQFMLEMSAYDFIFCRNVLIYFDRETQYRAVRVLDRLLKPTGLLFIGPSESGLLLNHDFASAQLPLAFAFHRKAAAPKKTDKAALPPPLPLFKRPAAVAKPAVAALPPVAPQRVAAPPQTGLDEISRLADQGRLQEAMQRCAEFLRACGPSARAFYLMGLVHDASGKRQEAEQYYRKALYLDPAHQETIIHLAFLLEQRGDASGAQQLHQRAKRVGARA